MKLGEECMLLQLSFLLYLYSRFASYIIVTSWLTTQIKWRLLHCESYKSHCSIGAVECSGAKWSITPRNDIISTKNNSMLH